jgi:hypothetical protein
MRLALLVPPLLLTAACYETPRPPCAFSCGDADDCPTGYTCRADSWCKRDDVTDDYVCAVPDAAPPDDGSVDGSPDAAAPDDAPAIDAPGGDDAGELDAGTDAAPEIDAGIDASPPDAMISSTASFHPTQPGS